MVGQVTKAKVLVEAFKARTKVEVTRVRIMEEEEEDSHTRTTVLKKVSHCMEQFAGNGTLALVHLAQTAGGGTPAKLVRRQESWVIQYKASSHNSSSPNEPWILQ